MKDRFLAKDVGSLFEEKTISIVIFFLANYLAKNILLAKMDKQFVPFAAEKFTRAVSIDTFVRCTRRKGHFRFPHSRLVFNFQLLF